MLIRTVGDKQTQMIKDMADLFCGGVIECDPTYSKGIFYKDGLVPEPKYKFDINPVIDGVVQADAMNLPLETRSVNSIIFDPPFIGASKSDKGKDGIIKSRFSCYKNIPELWEFYRCAMEEFHRVLKPNGILIFKCQDTVEHDKNYFSHIEIMNWAYHIGFHPKDLFILTAKARLIQSNLKKQIHARKFHSYFWVFEKKESKVGYSLISWDASNKTED